MSADDHGASFDKKRTIVIVGVAGEVHIGRHLEHAARTLEVDAVLCDSATAFDAPLIERVVNWRLRGHRPPRLGEFSAHVLETCRARRPSHLIATGLAPIDADTLGHIGRLGIRRINFLTDDPWNPDHHAPWFLDGLREYDEVFTPRTANLEDLRAAGCRAVRYMRFAYAPDVHFADPPATPDEQSRFGSDLVFIGGADADRVRWIEPFIEAGFRVALYGSHWERYPRMRKAALGMADVWTVRKAIGGAATSLCLVRRANRDGHSMRSFEVPAIGACMLVEDTGEHRAIFTNGRQTVEFVSGPDEACQRLHALMPDAGERRRLQQAAHTLILNGRHTWADRLVEMLETHVD